MKLINEIVMTQEQKEEYEKVYEQIQEEYRDAYTKQGWGPGAWHNEPDEEFYFERGYPCLILRKENTGHLCGYVGILKQESEQYRIDKTINCFGVTLHKEFDYDAVPIDANGGITFFGRFDRFIPEKYRDKCIFIGFDCAHAGDLVPSFVITNKIIKRLADERERITGIEPESKKFGRQLKEKYGYDPLEKYHEEDVYRDIHFVRKEISSIIDQLEEQNCKVH